MSSPATLKMCILFDHELRSAREAIDQAIKAIEESEKKSPESRKATFQAISYAIQRCDAALRHVAPGRAIVVVNVDDAANEDMEGEGEATP